MEEDMALQFQLAAEADFPKIRTLYWSVADHIHEHNEHRENLGWEKGVYPSDEFIRDSLERRQLYTLAENDELYACVILNSTCNEGYLGCPWGVDCGPEEVLIPHALAVNPKLQGKGIGKIVVKHILDTARAEHRKAVWLDVLGACGPAERLYRSCGFHFVTVKSMYYEDTGWTAYKLFEREL